MSSKIVKVSRNGRRMYAGSERKILTQCNAQVMGSPDLLKNYANFMKSGLPLRLLFYQDDRWADFSQEVVNLVKEGFQSKRAAIEVVCNGCHFMLDILYMIQVDLKTGAQNPIAWIDDAGNCVFPEMHSRCHCSHEDSDLGESSNTPEINLLLETELKGSDSNKGKECVGETNVKHAKVDQELEKNNHALPLEEKQESDEYASPIFGNTCGTVNVETARSMFISCLGSDLNVDILEVKKCYSSFLETHFELFQKQIEFTQKLRGKANVQYGWYVAAGGAPSGVMLYGRNGPQLGRYGYGFHLAAVQSANLSTMISDVNEKGLSHVVLCRVILGNVEVVHVGSKQFYPSDQCFDSGVDDLQNPNNYVIWRTNIYTHIFPECVVSFKTSPTIEGNPAGEERRSHMLRVTTTHDPLGPLNQNSSLIKMNRTGPKYGVMNLPSPENVPSVDSSTPNEPKSPWLPFTMLFEAISAEVAPNDMKLLHTFYESFRAKKMNREDFVRRLRSLVGDQVLGSTISVLQSKKAPNSTSMPKAREVKEG